MAKTVFALPVSRQAYQRFIERINLVFPEHDRCAAVRAALDSYLQGDRVGYAEGLPSDCVAAFEMLRYDVDLAIARSAAARERGKRCRKVSRSDKPHRALRFDAEVKPIDAETGLETDVEGAVPVDAGASGAVVHRSRRARRAELKSSRPKTRWRKLG